MRTILHDFDKKAIKHFDFNKDDKVFSSLECTKNCIACFSCWIKHPKKCCINDSHSKIIDCLGSSEEFIIISECKYGCYSASIKKSLERCIGYVLPYFTIRNNEIHHKSRFKNKLNLKVYFYGNIDKNDKKACESLVKANSVNLNASSYEIKYFSHYKEIIKCIQ